MAKKFVSLILAVFMLFAMLPTAALALPDDLVLGDHAADGDTSGTAVNYWSEGNELWADKSVFDNGDGSMDVLISLQAHQVAGSPDEEPVGAVVDGSVSIADNLGAGFVFGDSIVVNVGSRYTYYVSGGWDGDVPDGISVSVNGSVLQVDILGDCLLINGGAAIVSYTANLSVTDAGTYYVSGGCTVTASGAMSDRSTSIAKSYDAVDDGKDAASFVISGGNETVELGNNGYVVVSKIVYYKDIYVYSGEYPSDVMATIPTGGASYEAGASVNAVMPSETSVRGVKDGRDGTWTFDGWDESSKVANGDVTFTGTWSFDPDPIAYHELYQYSGVDDANVLATLPDRNEAYYDGNTVIPAMPSAEIVMTDAGTYVFNGWTPESVVIDGADALFTGTWLFEPKAEPEPEPEPEPTVIHVIYQYTGVIIDRVLATLPSDDSEYTDADSVTAVLPNPATVETDDGVWTFDGWTKSVDTDVTFTGTWTFTAKQQESVAYHVVYSYSGVTDESVMATLPSDDVEYDTVDDITSAAPSVVTVEVDNGTWSFDGWTRSQDDDEHVVAFIGTWTFAEKTVENPDPEQPEQPDVPEVSIRVLYEYSNVTNEAVLATLPVDETVYDSFDHVASVAPSSIEVNTDDGTWIFDGWTRSESDNLVTFTGSWTFAESTPVVPSDEAYHVVYQYEGVTDEGVMGTLPVDNETYANGVVITPSAPTFSRITTDTGVWSFDGWNQESATVNNEDVVFVGHWTFTENSAPVGPSEDYYVTYVYADVTNVDVWATIPEDETAYASGVSVTAEMPSSTQVVTSEGTWTFVGWDESSKVIEGADIVFTGTWTFVAASTADPENPGPGSDDNQVYHVHYRYDGVTDEEILATIPVDNGDYANGNQVIAQSPSLTLIIRDDGFWSFQGWDVSSKTIENADVEFVGVWSFVPHEEEYAVIYQYTDFDNLPAEVKHTLPVDSNSYRNSTLITAKVPSATSLDVEGVAWRFNGWDADTKTVDGGNVVFTGSWSMVSDETVYYKILYQYADAESLPAAVKATLPVDTGDYANGLTVSAQNPIEVEVAVGNDLWQFKGWDESSKIISDGNVIFTGVWAIYEAPPVGTYYGEHYMYSGSVGEEVLATLPTRVGAYVNGTTVVPDNPSSLEVQVSGGKWVFVGWDANFKVIENGDVTFYGTWNFVPTASYYSEHYVYEDVIDADVLATLPTRAGVYENGSQVFPINPELETVVTEDGTWTFTGWTPTVATVLNGDVTFYGHWTFVAKEVPKYSEVYQYDGVTEEAVLATLPTRHGTYVNGDAVVPMQPSVTIVETDVGIYTFNGWDTASRVVTDADVVFTGTWTFVEKEVSTKYSERYAYADVTESLVLATLPIRAEKYEVGVLVIPANPSATTIAVDDGIWTFDGWDAAGRVIIDQDVVFVGTWTFTPNEDPVPPPAHYYGEFYQYVNIDTLPEAVKATLPLRTGSYVPGDVVVPAAPSAESVEVENGVWIFLGWDAESQTIVDSDITFVGSWKFEEREVPPQPTVYYTEVYQYDQVYTDQIMQTLPTRHGQYENGAVVEAEMPLVLSIPGVQNEVAGTWTFGGWDAAKKVVTDADVVFTGTWNFTPSGSSQKYTEFYKYDQDYPKEVMDTLPLSARMFENGAVVVPANPTASIVEGEVDGKIGVWKFNGWDEDQKIVNNAAVIFTGSWTFEAESSYLTSVTMKVVWIDDNNASGIRPDNVQVKLFADGEAVCDVTLLKEYDYQSIFENLPAKNNGVTVQYSVAETIPEGYALSLTCKCIDATIDQPGSVEFILTNTLQAQGIAIPETGSMNAIWMALWGMLLVAVGCILFWPKRKHE